MDERPLGFALVKSPAGSGFHTTSLLIGFLPEGTAPEGQPQIENALVLRRAPGRLGDALEIEISPEAVMTMAGRPGILQLLQAEIELANAEGRTLDLERYAESLRGLGFQGHTVEYEAVGA